MKSRRQIKARKPLATLGLAAVLVVSVAMPTLAGTTNSLVRSVSKPAGIHMDPAAVPWDAVGPGWLVASWEPHPRMQPVATYLVLVSPSGRHYPLYRLPAGDTSVVGWSGDGQRILVKAANSNSGILHPGRYYVIDLKSGHVEQSFKPGGDSEGTANFTTPHGIALLAANLDAAGHEWLERYSLGGVPQLRYPSSFPRVHRWTGAWLESPDGTQIVMGAKNGVAIVNNNGTLAAVLPIGHATYCNPEGLWGSGIILVSCLGSLYEFSQSWSKPRELAAPSASGNYAYAGAWRIDGRVLVQEWPSCGPPQLGELHGHRVSLLVHPHESGIVDGTTSTALALEMEQGECGGKSIVVAWYRPSTNRSVQVLGPPVLGGWVTTAVGYPMTNGAGSPAGGP